MTDDIDDDDDFEYVESTEPEIDLEEALQSLADCKAFKERDFEGMILILLRNEHRLNNGDALAFIGRWLSMSYEVFDDQEQP
jgi:hypothetical protein